ncbi:YidC/Oxa1 family membrane protein insertase [bacterium]|nr:YidC/Oxa1 family membrane protein insertase [bacterium]
MLLFLYTVFIVPLESIMHFVLENTLLLTNNPTLALIGVSLVVTIGSLPLYHIAEKWQDREREIGEKLKPKLTEFKQMFSGATLNAYTNTLYRQNRYHPIFALRSIVGLLIQIPFFFAAYHLLSNYAPFNGVETLLFKNLAQADGWFFSINVMPFIMTAINLLSATIYGSKLDKKAKIQLYGIALLFLVVLYNSPSGLLFYWTMNNLFSLLKNVGYNLFYKDGKVGKSKKTYKARAYKKWFVQLDKALPNGWIITLFLFFAITLTSLIAPLYEASSKTVFLAVALASISLLITAFSLAVSSFVRKDSLLSAILFWTTITAVFAIIMYTASQMSTGLKGLSFEYSIPLLFGITLFHIVVAVAGKIGSFLQRKEAVPLYKPSLFFFLALSVAAAALLLIPALSLLATGGVSDFTESLSHYLNYLFMWFFVAVTLFSLIYAYIPLRWKTILTLFLTIIALYATANIFLFPASYGEMSHFVFKENIGRINYSFLSNFSVGLLIIAIVSLLPTFKNGQKYVFYTLNIVAIAFLALAIKESFHFSHKRNGIIKTAAATTLTPQFTFSKTGKNVVIVMLDRFIGSYVPESIKLIPGLDEKLDGFTWYKESLSPSNVTIGGEPSIMGGWDYNIHRMHNTRHSTSLFDKLDESTRILPYNFGKAGYKTTMVMPPLPWRKRDNTRYIENVSYISDLEGKYSNLWLREKNISIKRANISAKLLMFSLFSAAPTSARPAIYDDGNWLLSATYKKAITMKDDRVVRYENNASRIQEAIDTWSAIYYLPQISQTTDDQQPHFYYMSNLFPHKPYITSQNFDIEPNGEVEYPKSVLDSFGGDVYALQHLYTDAAVLNLITKWFDWMKQECVYDNTRIILVSDHGRWVHSPSFDRQKLPFSKVKKGNMPTTFNNLVMVKDFNQRGIMQVDSTFMTTADIPHIALEGIIQGENPYTGNPIAPPADKFPFYLYNISWQFEHLQKDSYRINEAYKIDKPSIFTTGNWSLYDDK